MLALAAVPVGAWTASLLECALVGVGPASAIAIANYTAIAGIAPGLIVGFAAYSLLRTFGFGRWWAYAAIGVLSESGLVMVVLGLAGVASIRLLPVAFFFGGMPGLGAALAFCATLRLGRGQTEHRAV